MTTAFALRGTFPHLQTPGAVADAEPMLTVFRHEAVRTLENFACFLSGAVRGAFRKEFA